MPIRGRTLGEAADKFRQHVNGVLSRTITSMPLVLLQVRRGFQLSFRQAGQPTRAALDTRVGRMWLYIGQTCDSTLERGEHRLKTLRYAYSLWSDGSDEPALRWEYVRDPGPDGLWCRHHLQGPVHLDLNRYDTTLNDLHLPTGYVPFEEIIRFCIVDLQVRPISPDWDQILRDSYEEFKADFLQ